MQGLGGAWYKGVCMESEWVCNMGMNRSIWGEGEGVKPAPKPFLQMFVSCNVEG